MTNTSQEPEEQGSEKRVVRIILPREVCTTPEEMAKIMYAEIQKALRGGSDSTPDPPRAEEE
jgi:hypothetical protein